jgi:Tol biopolymer transport system component
MRAFGIYEFDSLSTDKLTVRSPVGDGYRLAWLPDSRRVVVVDRRDRIHVVDVITGRRRTVLDESPWHFWGNVPPISPDGRTIYLGAVETQSDVWMVERQTANDRAR